MEENEEIEILPRSEKLAKAIEEFIKHLESLADTYPLVTIVLRGGATSTTKQFNEFLEKECTLATEEPKSYRVPVDKVNKKNSLKRKLDNAKLAEDLVPRSFVVSLVSEFDAFIGHLIRVIYYLRPELLNASEKNLSFSKLLELNSIEEGREFIIEKEVEAVLRDNHAQQFKWLENKLDTKLTVDLKSWSTFIELTERRNLFVHNNGIVNSQYFAICKANKIELPKNLRVGDCLNVKASYFQKAYRCVFELGIKLSQVIWRKFINEDLEDADFNFISVIYDQIVRKDYDLAIELSEFSTHKVIKHFNEETRLTCVVNKAQAYKWSGNNEKCLEIINGIDWSASSDKFKFVSNVLLNKFEEATIIMRRFGNESHEIKREYYKDWPVFKEFILSELFLKAFEEMYSCKFESTEVVAKALTSEATKTQEGDKVKVNLN